MKTTPKKQDAPAPPPKPKFDAAKVEQFFGPKRVERLKGLSNGRYAEHLADVCLERDDLAQVVLEITRRCGVQLTDAEREGLKLPAMTKAEPVAASGSDQAAPAQAPADDAAGES